MAYIKPNPIAFIIIKHSTNKSIDRNYYALKKAIKYFRFIIK